KIAAQIYRQLADSGNLEARFHLGWVSFLGLAVSKSDQKAYLLHVQCFEWCTMAASLHWFGKFLWACCFHEGIGIAQDRRRAATIFEELAGQGYDIAQVVLGDCYYWGRGVESDDIKAVAWFRKAAEQGNAWGQSELGCCYHFGRGVAQDEAKAAEWRRRSASQGY
ncbi:uncharacterized protein BJ171DRAFT_397473, partial [Polychytrium aggregatum]|uniref:uncharacterized protein n=1 Tax=Polychytrium aggregatum TaxID=110093 RepID=UPI0022FE71CE